MDTIVSTLKNGQGITLREATPADAEKLLIYIDQVAGESENITFGRGEFGVPLEQERKILEDALNSATTLFLLAETAGEIVGTITFIPGKRPRLAHTGEFGMSVLKKYWGQGVGSHLLARLVGWARDTKAIRKVNLKVRVDNLPAIHLYEKFGFVHEGHETRMFMIDGHFYDVFLMGLEIDPSV